MDPKIAAWVFDPELESFEFSTLVTHFMKQNETDNFEPNINKFSKDLLTCLRLWNTISLMLEKEELSEPFMTQEMPITLVLGSISHHPTFSLLYRNGIRWHHL